MRTVVAVILCLAALRAGALPVIVNPSFEADTFVAAPGYTSATGNPSQIFGWSFSGATGVGINPLQNGARPFADNGIIPDGQQVCFLQVSFDRLKTAPPATLSQRIEGFRAGRRYILSYDINARAYPFPQPLAPSVLVRVTLNGQEIDPEYEQGAVEDGHLEIPKTAAAGKTVITESYTKPFAHRVCAPFVSDSDQACDLVFEFRGARFTDSTVLIDNVRIVQDPPDVNTPPFLKSEITGNTVAPGNRIEFDIPGDDTNEPPQNLTYTLVGKVPEGASLDPKTGRFSWDVATHATLGNYPFTVRIDDDGSPPLNASFDFQVSVAIPVGPALTITVANATATLHWPSTPGAVYQVQWASVLSKETLWTDLGDAITSTSDTTDFPDPTPATGQRFYRLEVR